MRTGIGILLGVVFLGALIAVTLRESRSECEVCVEFDGRSACNTSSAGSREDAIAQATSSACSRVSGGVTDGIRCGSRPPVTVRCSE